MNTAIISKSGMESAQRTPPRSAGREEIALQKDQLHSWTGNHVGLTIEAREGAVWLTQVNDGADVILLRGDSFRVNRPGRVVAQGLAPMARLVARCEKPGSC